MCIKIIIIYLYLTWSTYTCAKEDGSENGYIRSFIKFKNKLQDFFNLSGLHKIEQIKNRIKKALYVFVEEAFTTKDISKVNNVGLNSNRIVKLNNILFAEEEMVYEEYKMSARQLIAFHGYHAEVHTVQTKDGYILSIHRVLPLLKYTKNLTKLALLHHGLLGSSDDWLLLGPKKALPYLLSDAGYDVWITNARGNKYSRLHVNYYEDSSQFWNFTFHEMGIYDLSAVINYLRDKSESTIEIYFIGHSMGATALLVLLSTQPQYNKMFKSATLLAPLVFMNKIEGPLKALAEFNKFGGPLSSNFLGHDEFMANERFPNHILNRYCIGDARLCLNPYLLMANGGKSVQNGIFVEKVLSHVPGGGSTKTIAHYLQLVNSGQFQMYQYDTATNLRIYGQEEPPLYNLDAVTLPIHLFTSDHDWLCTTLSIQKLVQNLSNIVTRRSMKRDLFFTHTDFVWGVDAPDLVFHSILSALDRSNTLRRTSLIKSSLNNNNSLISKHKKDNAKHTRT